MTPQVEVSAPTAAAMRALGAALGQLVRAGDVVTLEGPLGAGKTTLTQGFAAGLGVSGEVTSPTFVVSRIHKPGSRGVGLVHVDAYRLNDPGDIDALDLEEWLTDSVAVVEWPRGMVDHLSATPLRIRVERAESDEVTDAGARRVLVQGDGDRWAGLAADLARADVHRGGVTALPPTGEVAQPR